MSMDSVIVGIGKFRKEIAGHLDYPDQFYIGVKDGTPIITTVFVANTTRESRVLAECFNILPWDFNTHSSLSDNPDFEMLRKLFDAGEVDHYLALKEAGFQFFYQPNG